jgi:Methyltransferase domain
MMAPSLIDIARRIVTLSEGTKAAHIYALYDQYFRESHGRPITLLELGIYRGESLKVFASYFESGTVIGVDIVDRNIDFSGYPNIVAVIADQQSERQLNDVCARHAPNGLDIVIDDASHVGSASRMSYDALLPMLNPGGLYIVEDWGTGYWNDWPDGRALRASGVGGFRWQSKSRIPSHDFGMVGFLKSRFEDITFDISRGGGPIRSPKLAFMHVYGAVAVLKKLSA